MEKQKSRKDRGWFANYFFEVVFCFIEIVIIILYGIFVTYGSDADYAGAISHEEETSAFLKSFYPIYQDIHVMMFIGFGFLMTYLRTHCWSSVGINFLVAALTIQVYILFHAFWSRVFSGEWVKVEINVETMITADFSVAAVLITFGGVLGKISAFQMLVLCILETFAYSLNEAICYEVIKIYDVGGSIVIHTFGAYFGLTVAWIISPREAKGHPNNASSYNSNIFSMIGTLFLWMFWPSFNGAIAEGGNARHRAIINTVISLTGSCLLTYIFSSFYQNGLFHMEDILNASLAGGVIIGGSADLNPWPFASMLIGCGAGAISTIGFETFEPWLLENWGLHDTAGIHNLHGMPGFLGGVLSAIFVATLHPDTLGKPEEEMWFGRSSALQGGYQIACLFITIGIAITSGVIVGVILKSPVFLRSVDLFQDKEYYVMDQGDKEEIEAYMNLGTKNLENQDTRAGFFKANAERTDTQGRFLVDPQKKDSKDDLTPGKHD